MSHYLFGTLNLRRRVSPQYQHDHEQRLGHFQPWELGDHYQPSRLGLKQSLIFFGRPDRGFDMPSRRSGSFLMVYRIVDSAIMGYR